MNLRSLQCLSPAGFHRMVYREWGRENGGRPMICVHGLTGNGRDFDALAARYAERRWIVCPDVVGRGESDWLADASHYGYQQYLADLTALIARLDVEDVDWLGTSMGGLIGMMLAAQKGSPIAELMMNDVGPFIPKAALERIAAYVGEDRRYASLDEAEAHFREIYADFGFERDEDWAAFTESHVAADGAGGFQRNYDPKIAEPFRQGPLEDVDLWAIWDAVSCPTMVIRGRNSDLLSEETAAEMARRGPRAEIVEFTGCGHAPPLVGDKQLRAVRDWFC